MLNSSNSKNPISNIITGTTGTIKSTIVDTKNVVKNEIIGDTKDILKVPVDTLTTGLNAASQQIGSLLGSANTLLFIGGAVLLLILL